MQELAVEHKSEVPGHIAEFVALGPKIYGLRYQISPGVYKDIMKAKGIPRHLLEKNNNLFEQYMQQLEKPRDTELTFSRLERRDLRISLATVTRRGFCAVDTKTFHTQDEDGTWLSLPLGHYKTRPQPEVS